MSTSFVSAYSTQETAVEVGSNLIFENVIDPAVFNTPPVGDDISYDRGTGIITIQKGGVYEFTFGFSQLLYNAGGTRNSIALKCPTNGFVFEQSIINSITPPTGTFEQNSTSVISFAITVLDASIPLQLGVFNIGASNALLLDAPVGDGLPFGSGVSAYFTCEQVSPQTLVVPTLRAVSSVGTAQLKTGDSIYVQSVEAPYYLDKTSNAIVDGFSVLFTDTGIGRWFGPPPATPFPGLSEVGEALIFTASDGYKTNLSPTQIIGAGAHPKGIDWAVEFQQTIGVTAAPAGAVVVPLNTVCTFTATVMGRDTTSGEMVSTVIVGAAKNVGNVVTVVGTPTIILSIANGSDAALNTATVLVGPVITELAVTAVGVAGRTINWTGDISIHIGG